MKRILLIISIIIVAGLAGLIAYAKFILPNVGKTEALKIEVTPERLARGKYLAYSVCACMDCHSKRDWGKFSGPLVNNSFGQGGEEFNQTLGFPGNYTAKNITPFAIKDWTDGELLRAITCGVNKDGKALFPVMPYLNYGTMDKEDIYSIIAYIRSLNPIENKVQASESDFPMNIIINTIPQKANFTKIPDKKDAEAYGKYLFTAASCNDCHTQKKKGKPVVGMELAGGFKFPLKTGGVVSSANITPDKETGIGNWSEEAFVKHFKVYADTAFKPSAIEKGDFNTIMPWMMYSGMDVEDLKAIYAYLRTVKPVKNSITQFEPEQ